MKSLRRKAFKTKKRVVQLGPGEQLLLQVLETSRTGFTAHDLSIRLMGKKLNVCGILVRLEQYRLVFRNQQLIVNHPALVWQRTGVS